MYINTIWPNKQATNVLAIVCLNNTHNSPRELES